MADKRFLIAKYGVIRDTQTGFEWYEGPDNPTTWKKGKRWVETLRVDNGGWRMPTIEELRSICTEKRNKRRGLYLPEVFKTTGWWVWSEEVDGSIRAWPYCIRYGNVDISIGDIGLNKILVRTFAIRSI